MTQIRLKLIMKIIKLEIKYTRIYLKSIWSNTVQSAKQVINSKVREAEKNRQYEDFIGKQGLILSGIIKRLEYGNVIVDLGKAEGVIKDELIPREILKTEIE